jgi:hypothetical protein
MEPELGGVAIAQQLNADASATTSEPHFTIASPPSTMSPVDVELPTPQFKPLDMDRAHIGIPHTGTKTSVDNFLLDDQTVATGLPMYALDAIVSYDPLLPPLYMTDKDIECEKSPEVLIPGLLKHLKQWTWSREIAEAENLVEQSASPTVVGIATPPGTEDASDKLQAEAPCTPALDVVPFPTPPEIPTGHFHRTGPTTCQPGGSLSPSAQLEQPATGTELQGDCSTAVPTIGNSVGAPNGSDGLVDSRGAPTLSAKSQQTFNTSTAVSQGRFRKERKRKTPVMGTDDKDATLLLTPQTCFDPNPSTNKGIVPPVGLFQVPRTTRRSSKKAEAKSPPAPKSRNALQKEPERPGVAASSKLPVSAKSCGCPMKVPDVFIHILDGSTPLSPFMAVQFLPLEAILCDSHRPKCSELADSLRTLQKESQPTATSETLRSSSLQKSTVRPESKPQGSKSTPMTATRATNPFKNASQTVVELPTTSRPRSSRGSGNSSATHQDEIVRDHAPITAFSQGTGYPSPISGGVMSKPSTPSIIPNKPKATKRTGEAQLPPSKKPRVDRVTPECLPPLLRMIPTGTGPAHDLDLSRNYRSLMMQELKDRIGRMYRSDTHCASTDRRLLQLLERSQQPIINEAKSAEVLFLSGTEALRMVESDATRLPIITQDQQPFKWGSKCRPIEELFQRMEDLDRSVAVQVPSRSIKKQSFESRQLSAVRDRFVARNATDDPWNILDLRSPLPAAILPEFLTGQNCQLLPRLRDRVLSGKRAERGVGTRDQWNEWRDILEWVLLSEGGHNTAPHTDSHGLATWITVQEGLFGFGWMSSPTEEEQQAWSADPLEFLDARWRYVVLKPGQTVFFNSGTVHYVFRVKNQQTLALGGHVLQWSGIDRWLSVVAAQLENPDMTNEDMEWSAPKYVRVVAELLGQRLKCGRVDDLGGEGTIRQLLKKLQVGCSPKKHFNGFETSLTPAAGI